MKKFFGIFIALFLGIVMVFGVAGCNKEPAGKSPEEEEIMGTFYSVAYEGRWSAGQKNFIGICNSNDDLIELCTENNCGFYDEENPAYKSDMGMKVREYTEDFFKSKSLVVCAFTDSSYSGPLKVSSLEVIENTLTLEIERPFSGVEADVVFCWGFIIEVDKSIVSGITNSTYLVRLIWEE